MITQTSEIYAQSLLGLDFDVLAQLKQIKEVFENSHDLFEVLTNPSINITVKNGIIQSVFGGRIDDRLVNFLKILTEKSRIDEFNQIMTSFEAALDKKNNIKQVEIVSAVELSQEQKDKITAKLERKLNAQIRSLWGVNPDIIGGLIFKYDDVVIDSSLNKKIENFGKILK